MNADFRSPPKLAACIVCYFDTLLHLTVRVGGYSYGAGEQQALLLLKTYKELQRRSVSPAHDVALRPEGKGEDTRRTP